MNDLAGRVVHGPDLSGEGTVIDSCGHGTVMAGLIAGSGADSATDPGGAYTGMAPEATVVAVKVAGANGAVDVSTMLQAMHWVSAYASQYNIRVLNLSFGVPSTQNPSVDPLDYAVERLWNQGIVVVVAAGNSGPNPTSITKPGDDPEVLTVGAYNDADGTIPAWSATSPAPSRASSGAAQPGAARARRRRAAYRTALRLRAVHARTADDTRRTHPVSGRTSGDAAAAPRGQGIPPPSSRWAHAVQHVKHWLRSYIIYHFSAFVVVALLSASPLCLTDICTQTSN